MKNHELKKNFSLLKTNIKTIKTMKIKRRNRYNTRKIQK